MQGLLLAETAKDHEAQVASPYNIVCLSRRSGEFFGPESSACRARQTVALPERAGKNPLVQSCLHDLELGVSATEEIPAASRTSAAACSTEAATSTARFTAADFRSPEEQSASEEGQKTESGEIFHKNGSGLSSGFNIFR